MIDPRWALEILQWAVIVALAAGLTACLRALTITQDRIARGYVQPARLEPGDRVQLPTDLAAEVSLPAIILFASSGCANCSKYIQVLAREPEWIAGYARVVIWRDMPSDADQPEGIVSLVNQPAIFSQSGVTMTPFVTVLDISGVVVGAGLVSREEDLKDALGVRASSVASMREAPRCNQ